MPRLSGLLLSFQFIAAFLPRFFTSISNSLILASCLLVIALIPLSYGKSITPISHQPFVICRAQPLRDT
jgi:hypothetical protein